MKLKLSLLMLLITALVAGGCRDWFPPIDPTDPTDPKDPPGDTTNGGSIQNIRWCLEGFSDDPTDGIVDPSLNIHIIFNADGSVNGFTGCNEIMGEYVTGADESLRMPNLGMTKRACADGSQYESRLMAGLRDAYKYRLSADGSRLDIFHGTMTMGPMATYMSFRACAGGPGDPTDPNIPRVALGDTFELPQGGIVSVENEDLMISFGEVLEDNRCPIEVQCPWAGNARFVAKLSKGAMVGSAELNTPQSPRSAAVLGYRVELIDLLPHPSLKRTGGPVQYVAVLVVTK